MKRFLSLGLALLAFQLGLAGQTFAYKSPGPAVGYVNDFANVLDDAEAVRIDTDLLNFKAQTSNEIAVVTVKSLEGDSVESFANQLFNEWGIGTKDNNNGVLLLIAPVEKKVRIEVGTGLEGALTDTQSGRIIQDEILPSFRQGDFTNGTKLGVEAIKKATLNEYQPVVSPSRPKTSDVVGALFYPLIVFVIYFGSWLGRSKKIWPGGVIGGIGGLVMGLYSSILSGIFLGVFFGGLGLLLDFLLSANYTKLSSAGKSTSWWHSGGGFGGGRSGGGFGGFGGGRSGGGGASGGW